MFFYIIPLYAAVEGDATVPENESENDSNSFDGSRPGQIFLIRFLSPEIFVTFDIVLSVEKNIINTAAKMKPPKRLLKLRR
jgi:hypothetical protein